MKINFFKKVNSFKKKKSEDINANLYWSFIFYMGVIFTLAFLIFGFYLFMQTNKEFVLPSLDSNTQRIIKKERIDRVLNYFSERAQKSAEILNSPASVVDPSL